MNKQYQAKIYTRPYEREVIAENAKQARNMLLQAFGDESRVYKIDVKLECIVCERLYNEGEIKVNESGELLCRQCYLDSQE